jgi:hypothetical protein
MNNKKPCEKCEDRTITPNCHTNCTAYKKWHGERQEQTQRLNDDLTALRNQESWLKYQQEGRTKR